MTSPLSRQGHRSNARVSPGLNKPTMVKTLQDHRGSENHNPNQSKSYESNGLLELNKSEGLENDTIEENEATTPAYTSKSQESDSHTIDESDPRLSPLLAAELTRLRANRTQWEATLETHSSGTTARLEEINRVLAKINGQTKAQVMAADGIFQRMREVANVKVAKLAAGAGVPSVDLSSLPADEAASYVWARMRSFCKENGNLRASDLFFECDKDRSGTIDAAEFTNALNRMGIEGASAKVAAAVIQTADPNGDGQLDYKELLHVLKAKAGHTHAALSVNGHNTAADLITTGTSPSSSTPYHYRSSASSNAGAHIVEDSDASNSNTEKSAARAVASEARGLQGDNTSALAEALGEAREANFYRDEAAAAASLAQEAEELARETAES